MFARTLHWLCGALCWAQTQTRTDLASHYSHPHSHSLPDPLRWGRQWRLEPSLPPSCIYFLSLYMVKLNKTKWNQIRIVLWSVLIGSSVAPCMIYCTAVFCLVYMSWRYRNRAQYTVWLSRGKGRTLADAGGCMLHHPGSILSPCSFSFPSDYSSLWGSFPSDDSSLWGSSVPITCIIGPECSQLILFSETLRLRTICNRGVKNLPASLRNWNIISNNWRSEFATLTHRIWKLD
jgi:hypothetical protein